MTRSRTDAIIPSRTALLIIDVQNGICNAEHDGADFFRESMRRNVIPNIVSLRGAARNAGIEVVYTVIESLTADGRDRCLDYKLTGFHFPPGSPESRIIDALEPGPDEIVLRKTSSSLFNSTTFDYVMRNIGIGAIVVTGFQTDQCVDHTVRDGADRGYEMICVTDGVTARTAERHRTALAAFRGYCRQVAAVDLIAETERARAATKGI